MTKRNEDTPTITDIKGAAAYLGMSQSWVRCAVAERRITHLRVGRSVRFLLRDLDEFIERCRRASHGALLERGGHGK